MENKAKTKTLTYGWSQCVTAWSIISIIFSKNILFKENYIHDAWGEGLDFPNFIIFKLERKKLL